jgi:flagellar basal body-associated protein FliL
MEIAWIVLVVFLIAGAAITFFVLKRALKMAVRAAIVALILLIAVVGGISLWWFGTTSNSSDKQPATIKKSR